MLRGASGVSRKFIKISSDLAESLKKELAKSIYEQRIMQPQPQSDVINFAFYIFS